MTDDVVLPCRLAVLVMRVGEDAILTVPLLDDDARWGLPVTTVSSEADTQTRVAAIDALLGTPTTVLRFETVASASHDEPTAIMAEVDAIAGSAIGHWMPVADLDLATADPADGPVVGRWLRRRAKAPNDHRPPWANPGWLARASAWMTETVVSNGMVPVGRPVIHYLWSLTAILRLATETGDVYLKACAPIFGSEATVTERLATRTPGRVPAVIAVEPDEGWLLMADHGGRPMNELPGSTWPSGIATHAAIQRAWLDDVDGLRAAGATDRSLPILAGEIARLVDDDWMRRLSEATRDSFRAALPRWLDACQRLDELGPGPSLIHGDLHQGNIAVRDDGPLVFDWSDASIGHPFIDLVPYVFRTDDLAVRRAICDAYIEAWRDARSERDLREAADLGLRVGFLHQVVSYRAINGSLHPDDVDDTTGADVESLERALRVLDVGIDARRRT
jgi:Phosphotransferase enzyme family